MFLELVRYVFLVLPGFFNTRVMTRSTLPIAFPNTVPTARPICFAFRVVRAGTDAAFFDMRTAFLTTFFAFAVVEPAAAFVVRFTA